MKGIRLQLACLRCLFWRLKAHQEAPSAEKPLGLRRSARECAEDSACFTLAQGLHCVTSAWCDRVGCKEPCAKVLCDFSLLVSRVL